MSIQTEFEEMSSDDERFDGMFLSIAQQSQGIEPLLDVLFSFLRRKTDFFSGASPDKVEDLVLKIHRKHAALSERTEAAKKAEREKEEKKRKERIEKQKREEEMEIQRQKSETLAKKVAPLASDDVLEISADGTFDLEASATETKKLSVMNTAEEVEDNVVTASDDGDNEKKEDDAPPPPGNGGRTDKYIWTQTLSDLIVTVPVPLGTKTKQLSVDITNKRLKVGMKGQPPIIDGDLHKRVIVDDCFWTLEDGREVSISLQKDNKMEWWKCVVIGDQEIDTTKVQPENSKLGDLDAETRQTVEKMMFDQRQKAQGLPSSDELQKQEMLKKFMSSHPEMDFSKAKFS